MVCHHLGMQFRGVALSQGWITTRAHLGLSESSCHVVLEGVLGTHNRHNFICAAVPPTLPTRYTKVASIAIDRHNQECTAVEIRWLYNRLVL